jgi:predicted XRE-type DNA-binding protein
VTKRKVEAYGGSGNVFADLGLKDADALAVKADILIKLRRLINERGLTQVKAAKIVGLSQPDLSRLLRGGGFGDYSTERLLKMLTAFDQDIEIVMRSHRKTGEQWRIRFTTVAA